MSSTQIDRIKEKFAKLNSQDNMQLGNNGKRHSVMFQRGRTPVYANYLNSALSKSLKSLNTLDMSGDGSGVGGRVGSIMSMSSRQYTNDDDPLHQTSTRNKMTTPTTGMASRPLHKYQKSITCDLSSYIISG